MCLKKSMQAGRHGLINSPSLFDVWCWPGLQEERGFNVLGLDFDVDVDVDAWTKR